MTVDLLTAVDPRHEADLVAALEPFRDLRVVRRCADVSELVSVAAAGGADVAVVSASFRGLDREVLRTLAAHGVRVVGLCGVQDEASERTLRQLGVSTFVRPGSDPDEVAEALRGAGTTPVDTTPFDATPLDVAGLEVRSLLGPDLTRQDGPTRLAHSETWGALGGAGAAYPGSEASLAGDTPSVTQPPAGSGRGTIIAVWGPTGAPGRTTVAVTLAAVLAARDRTVLLVDADTWGGSVGQFLGLIDESPGLAAACRLAEQGALDVPALAAIAPEVDPGLRVVTGMPRADRWPEARPGSIANLLDVGRRLAPIVVVDCGFSLEDDEELSYDTMAPRRNGATLAALEAADELILVGAADPVGLHRLVRSAQEVTDRTSARRTVVINKVRRSVTGAAPEKAILQVLSRFTGVAAPRFLPWAPGECDLALWEGRTLLDVAPESPLTKALADLAEAVVPGSQAGIVGHGRRRRSATVPSPAGDI